jgi:hypothetical protein
VEAEMPAFATDGREAEWALMAESGPAAFGVHITEADVRIDRRKVWARQRDRLHVPSVV